MVIGSHEHGEVTSVILCLRNRTVSRALCTEALS